jgi:hypothetical protein
MSGAVRSGCVVVEAMQTADKYLRVLIFALLMKQLDFKLYTTTKRRRWTIGWSWRRAGWRGG